MMILCDYLFYGINLKYYCGLFVALSESNLIFDKY